VNNDQIENLPINGRRVDSFVLLTPAVTNDGEFGLISFRGIAAGQCLPHRWQRYHQTVSITRTPAARASAAKLSQDAVQEFQVLSNGSRRNSGRAMGGVIKPSPRAAQ